MDGPDPIPRAPSLKTPATTLRRRARRGSHDRDVVLAIIDECLICHVAFAAERVPMALPTAHARIGDMLYLHGSPSNRMLRELVASSRASLTFTLLDGLVFARSAMHHSMNYRSVVVFARPSEVSDPCEKRAALSALVERIAPGRMQETREASDDELRATLVVRLPIEEASAKLRSGPPLEAEQDIASSAWAGELPLRLTAGPVRRDPSLDASRPTSNAVAARARSLGPAHGRAHEWQRGADQVSTDRSRIDFALVHGFLARQSYWAQGVSEADLQRAMDHSFCFGLYRGATQLGFARVTSDLARFAYLADVFVVEAARGQGLGSWLIECVLNHPELREPKLWLLGTRDAHPLYARFGFERAADGRFMVRRG